MVARIEIGTEIGGWRVTGLIGQGAMSVVYLAERLADGEQGALKVPRPQLAEVDEFRRRFVRESRYASSLEHPNVVPIYDAGEDGDVMYLAMRYVRGADLRQRIAGEGPLDPPEALSMLAQVASALDAAHASGLLHRDVKPGNVLIASGEGGERPGHCYLTDFGLSKNPTKDSRVLTAAGEFVGSAFYTPPEQIMADEVDHRADVYSLACVLYECLVGEPPFRLGAEVDVMRAHAEEPPPSPSKSRPELPAGIDEVIATGMAKRREDRYPTCTALIEAAQGALGIARAPAAPGRPLPVVSLAVELRDDPPAAWIELGPAGDRVELLFENGRWCFAPRLDSNGRERGGSPP